MCLLKYNVNGFDSRMSACYHCHCHCQCQCHCCCCCWWWCWYVLANCFLFLTSITKSSPITCSNYCKTCIQQLTNLYIILVKMIKIWKWIYVSTTRFTHAMLKYNVDKAFFGPRGWGRIINNNTEMKLRFMISPILDGLLLIVSLFVLTPARACTELRIRIAVASTKTFWWWIIEMKKTSNQEKWIFLHMLHTQCTSYNIIYVIISWVHLSNNFGWHIGLWVEWN